MPDFTMYSGDDRSFNVGITNEEGDPEDVSDALSITYGVFHPRTGVEQFKKELGDGITVVTSVVTVTLLPEDTEALLGGTYIHELEIITAENKTYTALQGEIVIKRGFIIHE